MNYEKYNKAIELDKKIKNAENVLDKIKKFIESIDSDTADDAMLMVGTNRIYFNKELAKYIIDIMKDATELEIANFKKEFKSL